MFPTSREIGKRRPGQHTSSVNPSKGEQMFTDASTPDVGPVVTDPFLNTDDACGYLGVPKATLLTWRVRRPGYGPRAVKAGGRLKYRLSELERWLGAHAESFTDQEVEASRVIEDKPAPSERKVVRTRNRADATRREPWPGSA
jgi:hypothetical protein